MSLLFNMLSLLIIAFLPRNKHLLISWLQWPSAMILESPKIKSLTVSMVSPSICHEVMDQMPWSSFSECWVLSQLFHSPLSLSSRGSSLSAIRVVSSVYLRLLIYLPETLIPACASSRSTFHKMNSAYELNKQGYHIQPWHTPSLIWNHSVVPSLVLTVASWPAYRGLRRKVRWSGIPICWRIVHSLLWSTQRLWYIQ